MHGGDRALEIYLIRHGKTCWSKRERMSLEEFEQWMAAYDESGVVTADIPRATIDIACRAKLVVASDTRRAVESARAIAPHKAIVVDPMFREAELRVPRGTPKGIRLSPSLWAVFLRCLWFGLRIFGNAEAGAIHDELRARARKAARELIRLAQQESPVVLVGHGWFNMLIARELRSGGWWGPLHPSAGYWAATLYRSRNEAGRVSGREPI